MRSLVKTLVTCALLIAAPAAWAQMIPLGESRGTWVTVNYAGLTSDVLRSPIVPSLHWEDFNHVQVDNPDSQAGGSCAGFAWQISELVGQGMNASGTANGDWQLPELNPHYRAYSTAEFEFQIPATTAYTFDAWVDAGGPVDEPAVVQLYQVAGSGILDVHRIESGELHLQRRLAPGRYFLRGQALARGSADFFYGGTYSYIVTFSAAPNPFIQSHPRDTLVTTNETAVFSVSTNPLAAAYTFQWRRNGVVLVDDSHVSGVHTSTLTIANATPADTGWYEVTVTEGGTEEPSTLARLDVTGTSAAPAPAMPSGLTLELAGANPTRGAVALRYTVARRERVDIAVYDVTGARVRRLHEGEALGAGTLTWDGRDDAGHDVPAGLYFVRLAGPRGATHRSIARLR